MKLFRTDNPMTSAFNHVEVSAKLLKQNIWAVCYLVFLPALIISVGATLLSADLQGQGAHFVWNSRTQAGAAIIGVGFLYSLLASPAAVIMEIRAVRGETPAAGECFKQGLKRFFPYIFTSALGTLAITFGLIALIVPGLILLRSYYLATFFAVDPKYKYRPIIALKTSRAASKANAGYIWGTFGVIILFSFASGTLSVIPFVGRILGLAVSLIFVFGPALRYHEIEQLPIIASDTTPKVSA